MDRLNYSKRWQLAFILYASDHGGNYPTNFEQASSTFSKDTKVGEAFVPDEFEIVFQGSQDTIKNPANTIVLREKVARQAPDGRWQKAYGYADGHAEIHTDANGDFDAYEKERIIARTAQ